MDDLSCITCMWNRGCHGWCEYRYWVARKEREERDGRTKCHNDNSLHG